MSEVDKINNLGFQISNFAVDAMNTGATVAKEITEEFSKAVYQLLKLHSERDEAARMLKKTMDNKKNLSYSYCSEDVSKIMAARIKEQGAPCIAGSHVVMDKKTHESEQKYFILYREEDLPIVRAEINHLRLEYNKGLISTEELVSTGKALKAINGLNYNEAKLYAEHCKDLGLQFTLKEKDENVYTLVYTADDYQALDSIKMTVALELSGEAGDALKKQLDYEEKKYKNLVSDVIKNDKEMEIVDLQNHRLSASSNKVRYYDNGKQIDLDRRSPSFNEDLCKVLSLMKNPVELTMEEFKKQQYLDKASKKEFLYQKDKEHGRPELTKNEFIAISKMIKHQSLYEKKIAMENPVQRLYEYSYTNDEMRMATFESFEKSNKLEKEEQITEEIKNFDENEKELFKEATEQYNQVDDQYIDAVEFASNSEIDNFILEDDIETERDIFDNTDYIDLDRNGIPDDLEDLELND